MPESKIMRLLAITLFLFISSFTFAQTAVLKNAASKLDKALIDKDTLTLKQLLHADASYGHSNGWVEKSRTLSKIWQVANWPTSALKTRMRSG